VTAAPSPAASPAPAATPTVAMAAPAVASALPIPAPAFSSPPSDFSACPNTREALSIAVSVILTSAADIAMSGIRPRVCYTGAVRGLLKLGCLGLLVIGGALVALVAITGRGGGSTAQQPAKPAGDVGAVGQRVESAGVALTVNGVRRAEALGQFLKAKPERAYLVADVTVENAARDKAPYNPIYFKVKDGADVEYAATVSPEPDSLKSGELGPGERARGTVAFDIPAGASRLELRYQPIVILGGYRTLRVALE
jgi:hypothetical protein